MTEYVTTNIRLPKDVYREIKRRALEEEKSLAQVVRESVALYLSAPEVTTVHSEEPAATDDWESDPLWLIGTDATIADVTDGAVNHDLYLYGPLSETARAGMKD
jgi:Ribbon-helix-helix protein, copG family